MSSELDTIIDNQNTPLKTNSDNIIGTVLYNIGLVIITLGILAGLLVGILLKDPNSSGFEPDPHPLRWVYGIGLIVTSSISGVLFVGFGEVIKLLDRINKNTSNTSN